MKKASLAPIPSSVDTKEQDPNELDEYQLDNHVKTIQDAHKIVSNPDLSKVVGQHAKKKKAAIGNVLKTLDNAQENAKQPSDSLAHGSGKIKSIDDIRAHKSKLKDDLFGDE